VLSAYGPCGMVFSECIKTFLDILHVFKNFNDILLKNNVHEVISSVKIGWLEIYRFKPQLKNQKAPKIASDVIRLTHLHYDKITPE
jgi:hypothetical protein